MRGTLIISLFVVLRLGIPLITMLLIGEVIKRHNHTTHKVGGA